MARDPAQQPNLSGMKRVEPSAVNLQPTPPALPAYPASPNPLLRSPLPSDQQLEPDQLRQFYQRGVSQARIMPVAPAGRATLNSAAQGVAKQRADAAAFKVVGAALPGAVTGTTVNPATLDNVGDGSTFLRSVQYADAVQIDNANFEASTAIPPPGWSVVNATASYETTNPQSGNQSLKLVITAPFGGASSTRKYKVLTGELYRISGYLMTAGGANGQIQCAFLDKNGTFISQSIAQTTASSWTFISGTGTVPANAVTMSVNLGSAGGTLGTFWFDQVHVIRAVTAFEVTPLNTSGAPQTQTSPLTQSGNTMTIDVAGSTWQFGDGTVSYNSGSLTPSTYGTFFIYANDPGYQGGAVAYQWTQNPWGILGGNGFVYFGQITTVNTGGGTGSGGGTGGGGAGGKSKINI